MNRYEMDKERENFRTILKKMFSITEDAASNEEIRDRILSGGKITGKNIPIIAMTANSFAEDVQASLDAGMNAHLSKPIVIDEVIKTILRYVYG